MRRAISFLLAVAMLLGCAYALYFFLFEAAGYQFWTPAVAGGGLVLATYWLWEDFIKPSRSVAHRTMWLGRGIHVLGGGIQIFGGFLALCGVLVVLAQCHLWLRNGLWSPITITTALGHEPLFAWRGVQKISGWIFDQPLSATLVVLGFISAVVGAVVAAYGAGREVTSSRGATSLNGQT